MIVWATLKENGCVDVAGISQHPPNGYIAMPSGLTPEFAPYLMFVEGEWQERPSIPEPVIGTTTIEIQNCPDEVIAEISDAEASVYLGEVESVDGVLEIELPDPGVYQIELVVPEPWQKPPLIRFTVEESV